MLGNGLHLRFAPLCNLVEFHEIEISLEEHQQDLFHTEPFYPYFVYLSQLEKDLFDEDLGSYPGDESYDMFGGDLDVLHFQRPVMEVHVYCNQNYGNGEGSLPPGGVDVGCPGFLIDFDLLDYQPDLLVGNDVQMASDVPQTQRFPQRSSEYSLDFEDCALLDIYYLVSDAVLDECPAAIAVYVGATDYSYSFVYLENGDCNLSIGYDLLTYQAAADGDDDG